MESKDPGKRLEDILKGLKNIHYSYVPVGMYKFNIPTETTEQALARLDNDDAVIDSMTSYPTAERMLNNLFKKDN